MALISEDDTRRLAELHTRVAELRERTGYKDGLFAFNRNGLRMAIAAIEDETAELYEEWLLHKRKLGDAVHEVRHELLDVAACAMLAYAETFREET